MKKLVTLGVAFLVFLPVLFGQPQSSTFTPNTYINHSTSNAMTIIIDVSGSMRGRPLAAAKRSSLVLIDLIELWSSIYPNEIGNMQVQFILFGANEEVKVLQPLTNLKGNDYTLLKERIRTDGTLFGGTDYSLGIEAAIQQLTNKGLNNKTLFLTDAGDGGAGPDLAKDYALLGDTKFIIYGNEESVGDWLQALPQAEALNILSEFEVTTEFVATLFEFVDDINRYLVRRGKSWTGNQQPFFFEKHSTTATHDLIITRLDPSINLIGIKDEVGNVLSPNDYLIYNQATTFYQVRLHSQVPKGTYQLHFDASKERSQLVRYISFERCNIELKLFTHPMPLVDSCFIENENINFSFQFWDKNQQEVVAYPDFLNFVAYAYEIDKIGLLQYGRDLAALHFSKAFPNGSAGKYEVSSSWNYNLGKLKKGDPPLVSIDDFCVEEDGRLVELEFDTTQTWEGRPLLLKAKVDRVDSFFLKTVASLYVNTGKEIIELKQTQAGLNLYEGQIVFLEKGWYQLAIENKVARYKIGFAPTTLTQFKSKGRYFQIKAQTRIYHKMEGTLGFWGKIQLAISSLLGAQHFSTEKKVFFDQEEMLIPYELPFYAPLADKLPIEITLNKLFPDEVVTVELVTQDGLYPCSEVKSKGWWGAFQQSFQLENAVQTTFDLKGMIPLSKLGISQKLYIEKKEGDMYFEETLSPAPLMYLKGNLEMNLADHSRKLLLSPQKMEIALRTSYWSKYWTEMERQAIWLLLITSSLIMLIVSVLYALYRRALLLRKLQKWGNDCKHQSPEDFYALFPPKLKKMLKKLVAENRSNPTIFPTGLEESEEVRQKRIFRYKIRQQAQQHFDKKVVGYCTLNFLEQLADCLRQSNLELVKWEFALSNKLPQTIRIVGFDPDLQQNKEAYIRVRMTAETAYGDFEVREGRLFFHNCYNTVYIQDKSSGNYEWKDLGSATELSTGQRIQFGPDQAFPYFRAMVFFTRERLTVTITEA